MRAEDVAQYLQNNPQFFEEHAETLTQINLPHPHGGRTISLSERQLLALREKNKELEKRLRELIAFAQDNDALQHKVHEFVLRCSPHAIWPRLQEMIPHLLRDIFAIPHAVLRLWQIDPPSAEVLAFADAQAQPVCLHHAAHDTAAWFGEQRGTIAFLRLSAVACGQRDHRLAGAGERRQAALLSGDGHGVPATHRRSGGQCAASVSRPLVLQPESICRR